MIKLLQTGDLHLGKVFYEHSLIEDQKFMLDQLHKELENANPSYDALLITGDIYDRAVPPPEAVELFDHFLTHIRNSCPNLEVCIIAGNHDSPRRLAFGSSLFSKEHIHIATTIDDAINPVIVHAKNSTSALSESESVAVYLIPFLQSGSIFRTTANSSSDDNSVCVLHSQKDMIDEAVRRIVESSTYNNEIPAIACAHVFTTGAVKSDSERVSVGTAEEIDATVFKPFIYTALGHLHKPQRINDSVMYAGSPLAYSFSENSDQKHFLSITISATKGDNSQDMPLFSQTEKGSQIAISEIPITPLHKVVRLEGTFSQFNDGNDFDSFSNDYVEITYTDDGIIDNPAILLRKKFPYIMAVRKKQSNSPLSTKNDDNDSLLANNSNVTPGFLYDSFIKDIYGSNSDELSKACNRRNLFDTITQKIQGKDE